jgi:site-specific DNA-methyltransferase (adenine-specific)
MKLTDKIEITCEDNMALMARYPDKYFDLAIVDPPYMNIFKTDNWVETCAKQKSYKNRQDTLTDKKPNEKYFDELFRVSKNQIIWGGNYFTLPISRGWICWYKSKQDNYFSDAELAWSSYDKILKVFEYVWSGMLQQNMKDKESKIHPTQKPVALYKWILDKYAKQGDKILDTHLGSGSIAIACHDYGFDLTACELDKEYYNASIKRIKNHISQQKLF